jgi:hypothetical protein
MYRIWVLGDTQTQSQSQNKFSKKSEILRPKNFKYLLIFITKCIELNFESKPKLILGLSLGQSVTQNQYIVFFGV